MAHSRKSHETIAEPFFAKADRIEKNLAILKKAQLPDKIFKQIDGVCIQYKILKTQTLPGFTIQTKHTFTHPNLFLIVFFYKEILKIFNEVNPIVTNDNVDGGLSSHEISEMLNLKEDLLSLAFIGDSAIELGVIPSIWPTENSQEIPKKGTLDTDKKFFTAGESQSKLWNFLVPCDGKNVLTSQKSVRIKSSQFEAVFGIIYLEGGQEAIEKAIQTLKENYEIKS
jgi:23S rRNA maturation mini-RNase III